MVDKPEVEIASGFARATQEQRGNVELVRSSMSALAICHQLSWRLDYFRIADHLEARE